MSMKTTSSLTTFIFGLLAATSINVGQAAPVTYTHNLTTDISSDQIDQGTFEDIWTSSQVSFPQILLNGGDTLVLNVDFNNNLRIKVTDSPPNDDESIWFFIGGSGGVGGGLEHALPYTWTFTDPAGALEVNPVPGTGRLFGSTGNGVISPSGINTLAQRDIDLTKSTLLPPADSMFSFGDITLKVTVPSTIGAQWAPSFVSLGVDGDDVSIVPVPAAVWLLCSGLLGLIGISRRKKA